MLIARLLIYIRLLESFFVLFFEKKKNSKDSSGEEVMLRFALTCHLSVMSSLITSVVLIGIKYASKTEEPR